MGLADYWILDLTKRELLVLRQPVADATAPFGHRYGSVEAIGSAGQIAPLECPSAELTIADMLPPLQSKK